MEKNRWRASVLEGVDVLVGRLRDLAQHEPRRRTARRARWPPLRSDGVRSATSIANGAPLAANQREDPRVEHRAEVVGVGDEGVAVAGVEQRLEHARGHAARCRGRRGRAAPTPGPGRRATPPGVRSSARSLGSLFCRKSSGRPDRRGRRSAPARPASRSRVRKLFMSTSGSRAPLRSRRSSTWRAMRSRKRQPVLDLQQRLGAVMPIACRGRR